MPADENNDRKITLKELYTFVYKQVYDWTCSINAGGYQGPQHVQYYGPEGEVLFTRE